MFFMVLYLFNFKNLAALTVHTLWKAVNTDKRREISQYVYHIHISQFTLTQHPFTVSVGCFCNIMINGQYGLYANT